MRKLSILLATLLLVFVTASATATDGWTLFPAYHNCIFNQPAADRIYALYDGNLLSYSPADSEVRQLTKLTGLSDKSISLMGYSTTQRCLVLVYANANIDLLFDNGRILNIPQLKTSNDGTAQLNALNVAGDWAALATSTGVVVIDLKKREVKGSYVLGTNCRAAAIFNGAIFAARNGALTYCLLSDNPSDATRWRTARSETALQLMPFAGRLFYSSAAGLYALTGSPAAGNLAVSQLSASVFTSFYADAQKAVFANASEVDVCEATHPDQLSSYAANASWKQVTRANNGTFWVTTSEGQLQAYKLSGSALQAVETPIGGYGPKRDLCYYMYYAGPRLLVAGGRLDPYDRVHYPATLMAYENNRWSSFQETGVAAKTGVIYRDITSVIQDPADASHHFATSTTGLYEFRNQQFLKYYSNDNAALQSAVPDGNKRYIRLDGLSYDKQGNLWMVNNQVDTVLRVLLADGSWAKVYSPSLRMAPTLERTLIDANNNLWVASRRTVSNHVSGLLCLNFNGTPANLSDDVERYRSAALNEDGTQVDLQSVYALAQDRSGWLWVGTANGVFVVEKPADWFKEDFTITQVKVPRNDGTNYADYLLANVAVSAIAVDGANRKWLGTYGSGLYLVSPDGTKILAHFTAAKTPLLSDNIYSLAVNSETGEVMIGTDAGLCSYQGKATRPSQKLDEQQVKVYPNPVHPDYQGNITITGLTENAEVKVMTTGGQVVAGGRSIGGSFVWDACNQNGQRVATGVYYILVVTADADSGIVAKVTII